jgi:hypothetical protein
MIEEYKLYKQQAQESYSSSASVLPKGYASERVQQVRPLVG